MTLTEVSYYSRKLAPFGILSFLILLILFYGFKLLLIVITPPPREIIQYDPVFEQIARPKVQVASFSGTLDYTFDTVEGKPIDATEAGKVFFLPPNSTKFGFRQKIYVMANVLGFDTEQVKHRLVGREAIFDDGKRKLSIDITNYNFTFQYDFKNDVDLFQKAVVPSQKEAENKAADLLKQLSRYPEELARGKNNTIYMKYDPQTNELGVAPNPRQANVVEVDLYRPDIEDYPIVAPKYFNSQNYVLMLFDGTQYTILRAQMRFFEKSEEQIGVYPIRSGESAFEKLKEGRGIIVSKPPTGSFISIRKMFFGYLDVDEYQEYLQPVYVFLGDGNFVAYVPAITDEWIIGEIPPTEPPTPIQE